MKPKNPLIIADNSNNKKVYFGDNGEVVDKPVIKKKPEKNGGEEISVKTTKKIFKKPQQHAQDLETKWYETFEEYNTNEFKDIKDADLETLKKLCKNAFTEEIQKMAKNNPSDAKWLDTALHKGTSKDRANAGALLVQSNPLPNIPSLESLITLTKVNNKTNVDVLEVVTDLFINSLLPHHRKLIPLQNRANDWKMLNTKNLEKKVKDQLYAYWHYEHELKDQYHSYLLNLQASLQNGKEIQKVKAIISSTKLLKSCPEREGFLLTVLVNKFGDPDKKISSKATYHLRQILLTHPNMAPVMILEAEKLVFRNNISEQAQNYGIGFLSLIAPIANVESSQKLINICFCFFKIKIEKGDIKSKTMQSILNCLRVAIQNINDFNEDKKKIEITTPDVVNTIYRLIYLSNISIAFQALSLLLQLVIVQNENHDRYYNALYRKMVDPEIHNANNKITALYFHIIHRSIQQDSSASRAKAFVKRLLQMTLSFSPPKACGALIVISKILKSRPELISFHLKNVTLPRNDQLLIQKLNQFEEDDDEEIYKDVMLDAEGQEVKIEKESVPVASSSWVHVKNTDQQKATEMETTKIKVQTCYDPFKRAAAYCGAELSLYYELILMSRQFHPTVQVFVENLMKGLKIKYFGDPLKDFSLSQFLERFAFKNPKKANPKEEKSMFHHTYQPKGSRGQSVYLLTEQTCTEDERFIFDFIQRKREIRETKVKFKDEKDETDDVDDDEFDAYLDTLGAANDFADQDDDFDYMSEMQKDGPVDKKSKKKSKVESDDEPSDDDWESLEGGSEDENSDSDGPEFANDDGSETDQSMSEDELDGSMESGSEMDEGISSKKVKSRDTKKSKKKDDLFVAVDDFSELIEKNSSANHGTLGEIFNKDKSSQKQMDWEEKRHGSNGGGFKRKKTFGKKNFGPTKKKSRK